MKTRLIFHLPSGVGPVVSFYSPYIIPLLIIAGYHHFFTAHPFFIKSSTLIDNTYLDQWTTMCPVQTFYILLVRELEQKGFLKVPQPSKMSPRDAGAGTQVEIRKLK